MSSYLLYIVWTVHVLLPTVIVADAPLQMSPISYGSVGPDDGLDQASFEPVWGLVNICQLVRGDLRLTLFLCR